MSLNACWQLLQMFGPVVAVLWLCTTRPVNNLYARYLSWLDSKFRPALEKIEAEQAADLAKHHKMMADIKFRHLDVWYDGWHEAFAPTPCPLSRLRKCLYFSEFTYCLEADTGAVVFSHPHTPMTRRWHSSTLDLDN